MRGDPDAVEPDPAVVDAVEPDLAVRSPRCGPRSPAGPPRRGCGRRTRARRVALVADDQLGEDDGVAGVRGGVADVVLAGPVVGGVDHELAGLRRRRSRWCRAPARWSRGRSRSSRSSRAAGRGSGPRGRRRGAAWCPAAGSRPPKRPNCTPTLTTTDRSPNDEGLERRDRGAEVGAAAVLRREIRSRSARCRPSAGRPRAPAPGSRRATSSLRRRGCRRARRGWSARGCGRSAYFPSSRAVSAGTSRAASSAMASCFHALPGATPSYRRHREVRVPGVDRVVAARWPRCAAPR